jgi:putative flippase GtrA
MVLDVVWYFVIYHYIVAERFFDLGFVTMSPHVASLVVVFPITFFTGFWLNRNVAFCATEFSSRGQLLRYALSVVGSILLNYVCIKLFVEVLGVWPTPAKALTTLVCVAYSYLAGRYFTFKR